ncbi:OLC1v1034500C1 [Oldenlandia corymbosa var. corymbosa]|uniref:OLC1v1034500C1 n=1 Tax=Oldenlandia corymbosa var. corymbosa TaxID=529605 RepID=A0AAV1CS25_OLDCO|nr:OLC1v1034500C1 [Oldenlandia corymbosa var. corymbosa]
MRGGLSLLKLFKKRLLGSLQLWARMSCLVVHVEYDEETHLQQNNPPEDVKEGHFVVHAVDDGELRRFIMALSYLSHPDFLSLLQQAEAEFGFKQEGVLVVPCRHSDLEKILRWRG